MAELPAQTITVRVLLFARPRHVCGADEVEVVLAEGSTALDAFEDLGRRYPALVCMRGRLAVAVNAVYSDWERPLQEGDEVALIPPVSGGSATARALP